MGKSILSTKKIFLFWAPLAATWLMMSLEGPFLAALIARLDLPKYNLAAFGVAFSFALIIEAPIIMLMSASTALVKNRHDYITLRNYTFMLNSVITVLMIIGLIPQVFHFIAQDLIGLPSKIANLTYVASLLLLPWPAAIGFRRFYQGLLIRHNLTRLVAYGTIVRLIFMSSTALLLYKLKISGAYIGAAALSTGVIVESIFSRIVVRGTIKQITNETEDEKEKKLNFSSISTFYFPLALTAILALGVHPMVTFFMGKSKFPIESLAVLPVINSLIFVFRSLGLSYQEVIIALLGMNEKNYEGIKRFALYLGTFLFVTLSLILFTPALYIWFNKVSGLSFELAEFSILPARILVILPVMTLLISFQRSLLVHSKETGPIKGASLIEIIMIIFTLYITVAQFRLPGAIAAAISYTVGRLFANSYLLPSQLKAIDYLKKK
ncbi:MAG: hypothetical protein KAS21_07965 [Candidatus Aminicenantes bacterium]|nr:hypothetical protein [Candidatus Aminicenantes bacterium]MCK5005009.1 hypothetical protein [Candidatus Aminicenantes bacterium]